MAKYKPLALIIGLCIDAKARRELVSQETQTECRANYHMPDEEIFKIIEDKIHNPDDLLILERIKERCK